MAGKAVVSLTTGLEDPERVTVAFLVSVGAAEQGRETVMFLTKEAVRLALRGKTKAEWTEILVGATVSCVTVMDVSHTSCGKVMLRSFR